MRYCFFLSTETHSRCSHRDLRDIFSTRTTAICSTHLHGKGLLTRKQITLLNNLEVSKIHIIEFKYFIV